MADKSRDGRRMTVAAFLDRSEGTDGPCELVDGRVVAIDPSEPTRLVLRHRLVELLRRCLPDDCRPHVARALAFEGDPWTVRVPDVVVSSSRGDGPLVKAPRLMFELRSSVRPTFDLQDKL